jgi:hypothetical protein
MWESKSNFVLTTNKRELSQIINDYGFLMKTFRNDKMWHGCFIVRGCRPTSLKLSGYVSEDYAPTSDAAGGSCGSLAMTDCYALPAMTCVIKTYKQC